MRSPSLLTASNRAAARFVTIADTTLLSFLGRAALRSKPPTSHTAASLMRGVDMEPDK
jgi:hypothetical protein